MVQSERHASRTLATVDPMRGFVPVAIRPDGNVWVGNATNWRVHEALADLGETTYSLLVGNNSSANTGGNRRYPARSRHLN